jgi:hypothetical protein
MFYDKGADISVIIITAMADIERAMKVANPLDFGISHTQLLTEQVNQRDLRFPQPAMLF